MCENDDFDTIVQYQRRAATLSRRQFGALGVGAGLLSLVPAGAYAAATTGADVDIKTPDGTCDAYFVHPAKGKHPAVLIWPDIFGLRPAFKQMATRLAESGYSVLVVNPFYRIKKAPTSTDHDFDATTRRPAHRNDGIPDTEDGGDRCGRTLPWLIPSPPSTRRKRWARPAIAWVARSPSGLRRSSRIALVRLRPSMGPRSRLHPRTALTY